MIYWLTRNSVWPLQNPALAGNWLQHCAQRKIPLFYGVGYVTFTDEAKAKILRVQRHSLTEHTAVSEAVVTEMAQGAKEQAEVDISMAISGYGGPEGGEDGTPAGTVWFGSNINNTTFTSRQHFSGDCQEVLENVCDLPSLNCFFC